MAVTTRNRRASVLNTFLRRGALAPNPDASLASAVDRQHLAGDYVIFANISGGYTFAVPTRTRTFAVPERIE